MDLTVCIATFGDPSWRELAMSRAVPSAQALRLPIVYVHAETLHEARNEALAAVETEWVVHLDADDELEPPFVDAMRDHSADLRAPAVRYVRPSWTPGKAEIPKVAGHKHACSADCLRHGNWLVVGTVARTQLLRDVGGWRDWPVYEDYELWLRCWLAGASIEPVPRAVYRAHVRPDSRNRGPAIETRNRIHHEILLANGLPGLDGIAA